MSVHSATQGDPATIALIQPAASMTVIDVVQCAVYYSILGFGFGIPVLGGLYTLLFR